MQILYICINENEYIMKNLPKDVFVSSIESIRLQTHKDIVNADYIGKVFHTDTIATYDNSSLVKVIIALLQVHFPKDENGFCEIEHYCFDMNFGKISGQEVITPEDLWYQLNKAYSANNLFLIDEVGQWPGHYRPNGNGLDIGIAWKLYPDAVSRSENEIIPSNNFNATVLYSKENQDRIFKKTINAVTNPIFEDVIEYGDLVTNINYVVEIKSIEQLILFMPDCPQMDDLKELFEIDKNHKEYIGFGSSITKGWKPLFIHPEDKVIIPFEKVKNIPTSFLE
jgi:hypothetical protein